MEDPCNNSFSNEILSPPMVRPASLHLLLADDDDEDAKDNADLNNQ